MITSTFVMRKEAQLGQYKKIPRFNIPVHVFKIFFIKVGHVLSFLFFILVIVYRKLHTYGNLLEEGQYIFSVTIYKIIF